MKKAIAILLTALLLLTVFVSCEGDVEDLFGDNITITFNGNGSTSGQMAQMTVKKGEDVTLPANEFTRTDFVFTGWNTQADGKGTDYADGAKASFDDNTVLYAQWAEELTITFNGNGSTSGQMAQMKVKKGEDVTLPANEFTRTDYDFAGWNTQADGKGTDYADGAKASFDDNTVLYAQWAEKLTITFNANNGSGTMDPVKVSAGVYKLPENVFTAPEGYALFVRWSETADGEVEYEVGDELEVTEDVTLYAIWAKLLSTTPGDLNGRYTITENTPIDNRFRASGTLKLYLPDGLTLNAKKGITVTDGNTLVIDKVGTNGNGILLIDEVGSSNAGIGSGNNQAGGTVTINGGSVTANGGSEAAGIGGGRSGAGGTVTINGGTVNAQGGQYGAGIGGGHYKAGGTVTINGGTVTATGGQYGAGIGGGNSGAGGTISIRGGDVEANGGSEAAGIGGGRGGAGGTVTIKGGTVTANGGLHAAGIGAGNGSSDQGALTIGAGVSVWVKDSEGASWESYVVDVRHRYMKAEKK